MNTNVNMTKEDYKEFVDTNTTKSNILKNIFFAFVIGGMICCLGQLIIYISTNLGFNKQDSATICTIILIFLGAFLTSINLYSKLGKIAGAGSTVPITGFSNSIVAPAIEYKTEGYILGLGSNMFKVAGPVLVYGITSSFIIGIVYLIFKSIM